MDENDPASPIIHIGYAKAASTWLQKQIFARHEMGFHKLSRYDASGAFTVTNHLDHDPEAIRRSLQPWLDEASERGLVPVISLERLVGHFDLGGYDSRSTADRLHETYGQARIIIVVREQAGIILSSYRHYSRAGGGGLAQAVSPGPHQPRSADLRTRPLQVPSPHCLLPWALWREKRPDTSYRALERGAERVPGQALLLLWPGDP